jgi:hypothetical protein
MANKYTDRVLPYLAQLTKSQIERGLITYVVSLTPSPSRWSQLLHSRGEESVADFRKLVETPPPFTRTSLRHPTASERRIAESEKSGQTGLADMPVTVATAG